MGRKARPVIDASKSQQVSLVKIMQAVIGG
jgi:hypothetical protein